MSRQCVLGEVSAERIRRHVEHICSKIPHLAAGSVNGKRMAEFSRDALIAAGVSRTEMHELPAIVSFPEHAECRVEAPTQIAIQANTLGHSVATMPEGITGELIYVGSGDFADYEGKDVRGKIILTELSYSPARHEKQRIAGLKGTIGAVMMNWDRPITRRCRQHSGRHVCECRRHRTTSQFDAGAADLKSLTHSRQNRFQELQIESGTRIMDLPVPM